MDLRLDWWERQGVSRNAIQLHNVLKDDLAHYSKATLDLMYRFPHGMDELEGIANRTDFDLGSHTKQQGKLGLTADVKANRDSTVRLAIQDLSTNKWFVPFVIEPSAGVERALLAVLNEAYEIEQLENGAERTLLRLPPHLAPIKVAVMPLKRNHDQIVSVGQGDREESPVAWVRSDYVGEHRKHWQELPEARRGGHSYVRNG